MTANTQTGQVTPTPDVIPPGFSLWDFYAAKRLYRGWELSGSKTLPSVFDARRVSQSVETRGGQGRRGSRCTSAALLP